MSSLTIPAAWVSLSLVLFIVKQVSTTGLFMGLSVAALVTAILALFVDNAWWQLTVFVLLSCALGAVHFLWFYRKSQPEEATYLVAEETSQLIDQSVVLKHDLPYGTGRVHVEGKLWKVRAEGALQKGMAVRITDVEGDTLIIQPNILNSGG
jgi:membrane protein implicated in regulation of membrane protease activity